MDRQMQKFKGIQDVLDCVKYGGWKLYVRGQEVSAGWLGSVSLVDVDKMLAKGELMKGG